MEAHELPNVPVYEIRTVSSPDSEERTRLCIWTQGCNLHCPYCPEQHLKPKIPGRLKNSEIIGRIFSHEKSFDGVLITGGEPTIHTHLPEFLTILKQEKYFVQLETNGTNPDMLHEIIDKNLIDSVKMAIKTSPNKYRKIGTDAVPILYSIFFITRSKIKYEFCTTVDNDICTELDVEKIRKLIPDDKKLTVNYAQANEPEPMEYGKESTPEVDLNEAEADTWKALKNCFGEEAMLLFKFAGCIRDGHRVIFDYKHKMNRRHIYIDQNGNTYQALKFYGPDKPFYARMSKPEAQKYIFCNSCVF